MIERCHTIGSLRPGMGFTKSFVLSNGGWREIVVTYIVIAVKELKNNERSVVVLKVMSLRNSVEQIKMYNWTHPAHIVMLEEGWTELHENGTFKK